MSCCTGQAATVECPECGHVFTPAQGVSMRVTENTVEAAAAKGDTGGQKKPFGKVEYADPGYQADGKARYPIDTEDHVRAAWSYISQEKNAKKYPPDKLKKVKARIKAAMRKLDIAVSESSITEALINGSRSWDDLRELVRRAVRARLQNDVGMYCWAYIVDISDTEVVYMAEGDKLYQCGWSLSGDEVELGEAVEVERTYAPATASTDDADTGDQATEARTVVEGLARVIEAKGQTQDGGRIFGVQVIAYGDSKNNRRYPETVLRQAVSLYEGAKAYDHHRTDEEMRTGTIKGLVGYYRNATATSEGIEADLHLLPSAQHAAEALDAALAQDTGEPLVGISHDVYAKFRGIQENGHHLQEATEITSVSSADIVAHPAAGGKATRAVAGGIDNDPAGTVPAQSTKESGVEPEDVLAALGKASDEQLAAVGLVKASSSQTTETEQNKPVPDKPAERSTETDQAKDSFLGRMLITHKVDQAGLPASAIESVTAALPDRITEATVDAQIAAVKAMLGNLERAGLAPKVTATVTQEAFEKKVAALDAMFAGNYTTGYRSFRHAHADFTGRRRHAFDEDENRIIMRESIGGLTFDSSRRASESMDTTSWDVVLGDSITRRMIALYSQPGLQTWRKIVSDIVPVNDFRTQRRARIGGYGTLPIVNQGAPYQPLQSPTDEEAVYAVIKRGGTEDLTLEMIANDDMASIRRIPQLLGLAAAITLYRFVWDILPTNAATTYDSVALFHSSHANTDNPAVLSQSTLSVARRKMRKQSAYGDSSNVLSITPKLLVVPPELEEIAYQLVSSAVAIPATPAGPSDTPNIHQGLDVEVVDYYSDTNDWYAVADPSRVPTIEVGFYQGREEPELFTQADPTVGSMFNADKLTYKIRHVYSGTPLEHRGFYRGAN